MIELEKYGRMLLELQKNSKLIEKEKTLKKFIVDKNSVLAKLLKYTLNPYVTWGISDVPQSGITTKVTPSLPELICLLNLLASRELTGNAARNSVYSFFQVLTPEARRGFLSIIRKDPSCGIASKTVNKVFSGLIPTFNVGLASSYKKYPSLAQKICNEGAIIDQKENGQRRIYIDGKMYTRTGMEKNQFPFLNEYLQKTVDPSIALDGEIIHRSRDVYKIHSLSGTDKEFTREEADIQFVVFDVLPVDDWWNQDNNIVQHVRTEWVQQCRWDDDLVIPVKSWRVDSFAQAEAIFMDLIGNGGEGVIIKNPMAPYLFKRSTHWIKWKVEISVDLPILNVLSGEKNGKFAQTLGRFECLYNGVKIYVSPGKLTNAERDYIWLNKPSYIGRTIEVIAQEITPDGSLLHPICYRVREDK